MEFSGQIQGGFGASGTLTSYGASAEKGQKELRIELEAAAASSFNPKPQMVHPTLNPKPNGYTLHVALGAFEKPPPALRPF